MVVAGRSVRGHAHGVLSELPSREDAEQGALGDAGVIAVLGAVAGHMPDEIARRITSLPDGTYTVTLSEARRSSTGAVPTGRLIELRVTPELPVYDHSPGEPAYAKADRAAWAAIAEKALAGIDETWTARRRAQWADTWAGLCAKDAADQRVLNPRRGPAPSGYVRLNQEATALDHAEMLTQFTGHQAVVRTLPRDGGRIRRVLRGQVRSAKPVVATARGATAPGEMLPYRLIAGHCYEITAVGWRSVLLRNPWGYYHPARVPLSRFTAVIQPTYATLA